MTKSDRASVLHRMVVTVSVATIVAAQVGCDVPPTRRSLPSQSAIVLTASPGDDLQSILDAAGSELSQGQVASVTVRLQPGIYRPLQAGQAYISLLRQHDGITLEGVGDVTLSAANPKIAEPSDDSFPAVVNHVVYFGDGITGRTILRGLRITGANRFAASDATHPPIDRNSDLPQLERGLFYYLDGGAIKVFGRSYPRIDRVIIEDNETQLCGGGVSIEHRGFSEQEVIISNCVFRNNKCPGTGSAIDVLGGSAARIENCLFVGNIANLGMDAIARDFGLSYNSEHGCGALTVFPESRVNVSRCTFTDNWNGVDDRGEGNRYEHCIFWKNMATDGSRPGHPYELDIMHASGVYNCFVSEPYADLQGSIDRSQNRVDAPDPEFDQSFRPTAEEYRNVGYRPLD